MDVIQFLLSLIQTELFEIKFVLGAFFGLCLGLTGVGGGVLLIPMLQIVCDMNPVLAVGTASLISSLVKVTASMSHIRAKNVSWPSACYLFVGALPVSIGVTQAVVYFNEDPLYSSYMNQVINTLIIIVMIGSLIAVLCKYLQQRRGTAAARILVDRQPYSNKKVAVLSGVFCGSILGSTGVGGGVLLLPVLNSVLKVDIKKAIGTSVVLAFFLSMVTALGYLSGGQADVHTAALFTLGSFLGIPIASWLLKSCSSNTIYIFTLNLIVISLLLTLFE
ncbi:sulfite exporter TauE/SafE family protein [Vibrio aquaticus]|uniref:Probable membrane transporter protein n=1 Tax=Vibrio aquaticus TaxID=2496559 RepID=A0A432D288_9VIBR|nr:sulfite exporter TauE/SafE family protein [Vibrio aquaticus]RTZ18032.1 sulfite exporter TauE/SafE family protein [Vibrio aquaticus]